MSRLDKLTLKKFKAFKDELIIEFNNKNLLLYGENGAGKSSIYEALKIIFFKNQIIPQGAITPEEQEQLEEEFWTSYNNKNSSDDFDIEINEDKYSDFDTTPYQVFMISFNDVYFSKKINLIDLVSKLHINDVSNFCSENSFLIESEINLVLKEYFMEEIQIQIDVQDDYTIKISDPVRNLETKTEIKKYFNEAILNLIVLLLLLNSIKCEEDHSKTRILVLDDFITSLDISNRTFLIRYIFKFFPKYKKLIFTHNINLHNLINYIINEREDGNDWISANLYNISDSHKIQIRGSKENVSEIKEAYNNGLISENEVGNKIRQKFEVLLYEFSKLLMVGAVEDSNNILSRIENSKNLYIYENNTASNLVDEITSLIKNAHKNKLEEYIVKKIDKYKHDEFDNLKNILKQLKIYRKVTMHPLSHGTIGQRTFSRKEIKTSLILLEKFETYFNRLIGNDVSGI